MLISNIDGIVNKLINLCVLIGLLSEKLQP